jgi:hypothetical protein
LFKGKYSHATDSEVKHDKNGGESGYFRVEHMRRMPSGTVLLSEKTDPSAASGAF